MLRTWIALLCFTQLALTANAGLPSVSVRSLAEALPAHLEAFPEVKAVRTVARRHRGHVWVFGGAAATWVHQLKWRMLDADGQSFFNAWPLTQRLAALLRPNQDLDVIVDAETPEEAAALAAEIPTVFQGRRVDVWQRRCRGGKTEKCVEGNADILHQHSDGHSLAVLELTKVSHQWVVRDLDQWNERSAFLAEVASGTLRMRWSPTHAKAPRSQKGMNPELYAVIRALTKAFAFDLAIAPEDRERMRTIIAAWNPAAVVGDETYARHFLVTHASKLGRYGIDLVASWDTMDDLGLREKLAQWADALNEKYIALLFRREPLRPRADPRRPAVSYKRSHGGVHAGRTAASIGLVDVAHDTGNFDWWDQVLRTRRDRPGFFVSRPNVKGETNNVSNTGVFASRGSVGARHSGYPIRLRVRPDAVEGIDFFPSTEAGLERNGSAMFFATSEAIELADDAAMAGNDPAMMLRAIFSRENIHHRALRHVLLQRIGSRDQYDATTQRRIDDTISRSFVREISRPLYEYRPSQMGEPARDDVVDRMEDLFEAEIFTSSPRYPRWQAHLQRVRRLHRFYDHPEVLEDPALEAFLANLIDIEVEREVREKSTCMSHGEQICLLLARPEALRWSGWAPTVEKFIRDGQPHEQDWKRNHGDLVEKLLKTSVAQRHPEWFRLVALLGEQRTVSVTELLATPVAVAHQDWFDAVGRCYGNEDPALQFLLESPAVASRPEWWTLFRRLPAYEYWRGLIKDATMGKDSWAAQVRRALRSHPDTFTGALNPAGYAHGKSVRQAIFFLLNYDKVVARNDYPSFVEALLRHDDARVDAILMQAFDHVGERNERTEDITRWRLLLQTHGRERQRRLPPAPIETCDEALVEGA